MLSAGRWCKFTYNQILDDSRPEHGVPNFRKGFLRFLFYINLRYLRHLREKRKSEIRVQKKWGKWW
jgi:hypothetical protein